MAATRTRKKRFDPDEVVIAIESFVTADNRVIHQNDRLRGDDPLVTAASHLFVEDGSTSEEIGAARVALAGEPAEPVDDSRIVLPGQLTAASPHALVVTADAHFTLEDGSLVRVREGDLVDGREPWVAKARKARRGAFRKA